MQSPYYIYLDVFCSIEQERFAGNGKGCIEQ